MTNHPEKTLCELTGLRVNVDSVKQIFNRETLPDYPFVFRYDLSIQNNSNETVVILARKWVVENVVGEKLVVEGDGVVGETPRLKPGERFCYHSYHHIDCDSTAEGAYFGVSTTGQRFFVRIPAFDMIVKFTPDKEGK